MKSSCIIEPHYLPSLAYFHLVNGTDVIYLDVESKFVKQTYRNRCRVLLSNKIGQLVIPIKHNSLGRTLADVKIDYTENWHAVHWKTIKSAYGKTPFFEHYAPFFEQAYLNPPVYLIDFVVNQLKLCFKLLGWKKEIVLANTLSDLNVDESFKNQIHSKKSKFEFTSNSYHQAFGDVFSGNLSVIDLLFNIGPEASDFIRKSDIKVLFGR